MSPTRRAELLSEGRPAQQVSEVGEKRLIRELILPLFNPNADPHLPGDDCGVAPMTPGGLVVASTDRVPADLTAFRLGIMSHYQLGAYLAALNISDVAAMGGTAHSLLLNLAFPGSTPVIDLAHLLEGVHGTCAEYGVRVIGGDLSDSAELNLVATVIGTVPAGQQPVYRSGARPGDLIFCTQNIGLTPTAFAHFLGDRCTDLDEDDLAALTATLREPRPQVRLGPLLGKSGRCTSMMDQTDGVGQTLLELAEASKVAMQLDRHALPLHPVVRKVAMATGRDAYDLALAAGADLQLVGTVSPDAPAALSFAHELTIIGRVVEGEGLWLDAEGAGRLSRIVPSGWNYFAGGAA
jgi:thiamine-monophosphate kinase